MATYSFEDFLKQTGGTKQDVRLVSKPVEEETKTSIGSRMLESVKDSLATAKEQIKGTGEFADTSAPTRGFQLAATATGLPVKAIMSALPEEAQEVIGKIATPIKWLGDKIGNIEALQKFVADNPQATKVVEEIAQIAQSATETAGNILATQGALKTGQQIPSKISELKEGSIQTIKKIVDKSGNIIRPKPPTPTQAVAQIIQGETKDIPEAIKAFSKLNMKGVKTYEDLSGKISSKIDELATKVTEDLGQDTTKLKLQQLATPVKVNGKNVYYNYVRDAISDLKDVYSKAKDIPALEKIIKIEKSIDPKTGTGITRQDVNNLAKEYGIEFKNRAFNKVGDALTGTSAQAFENTREGLKTVARLGIKGKAAQIADKQISRLYNVNRLVKNNVEAVNKLKQRIQERGLAEKIGYTVAKYGDVLTGGSLRGFVGGLLPRGAGYKIMNALDLEKALERNLDIIQKAVKSKSDAEFIKIIKTLPRK